MAQTLGVARSNVIERRDGTRPRLGPQERFGDVKLAGTVRSSSVLQPHDCAGAVVARRQVKIGKPRAFAARGHGFR